MSDDVRAELDKLTLEEMRADLAAVLDIPVHEIADDDFLPDLGLDSIRAMVLIERWSKRGAKVGFSELAEHATLGEWAVLLCA